MALSNWDRLVFGLEGVPVEDFVSPLGVRVEPYKNWLYLHDPATARSVREPFTGQVVAEFTNGAIRYRDVELVAVRGPQEGVYWAAWSGSEHDGSLRGAVGCGVYGYDDDGRWVGVTAESRDFLQQLLAANAPTFDQAELARYAAEGVDAAGLAELGKLRHHPDSLPKPFWSIDLGGAVRRNQGDAYFAEKLGIPDQATPVGEASPPVLRSMLGVDYEV